MFKFYIDNQLTDQPDSDTDLVTTMKRDNEAGGFLITQELTLLYSANDDLEVGTISGYTYLKSLFDSGTCFEAEIIVYDEQTATNTYRVFTGVIKVPSMELQLQTTSLSCKIDDNSFDSYINNNKNVTFNLYATKTKNGEIITPPPIYALDFFNSFTGAFNSTLGFYYSGYRIYDVLKFLIPAISDNKVSFESDYLRTASHQLMIYDGFALSNPGSNPNITASFDQIRRELYKLKNLFFYIDQTDPDAPVLRMEDIGWFYTAFNVLTFDEPLQVKTTIKTDKLYGTIKVGSSYNPGSATVGSPVYTWNAGTSYYGWKEETYTPTGQCNRDIELDLINDFLISSNAVNDQVNGATTSNLDKMFIVEAFNLDEILFTGNAFYYSFPTTGTPFYYNMGLNNVSKIQVHGSNFQSALTNTQNAGTNVFRASMGQDTTVMNQNAGSGLVSNFLTDTPAVLVPVPFADEFSGDNYDPGGNYNNTPGNYDYVVPVDGDYSFAVNLHLEAQNLKTCTTTNNIALGAINIPTQYIVNYTVSIEAYTDNTFSTLITSSLQTFFIGSDGTYNYIASLVAQLTIGNAVRVRSSAQFDVLFPTYFGNSPLTNTIILGGLCGYQASEPKALLIALEDSTFECNGTPEGAIIPAQPDPTLYKAKLSEFDYPISETDFRAIAATPLGSFEFIKDGISRIGWIEMLQHAHQTGQTKIKLITQDATA